MKTLLQGLPFDTPSPSYYRLIPPAPHADTVDISCLGPGEWALFHEDSRGGINYALFPTRDAAVGMVAQAFREEGL